MRVIFLDIDGVLNGYSAKTKIMFNISKKLHFYKFLRSHYNVFGVRIFKTFLLWLIVKFSGAKIVLSSSWRVGWDFNKGVNHTHDQVLLEKVFHMFHMKIFDVTESSVSGGSRGLEIQHWLNDNPDVTSFVILDDEKFGIIDYYPDNLVITSKNGIICGYCNEHPGLKLKHVIKSVFILRRTLL